MTAEKLNELGKNTALLSFAAGTSIFVFYVVTSDNVFLNLGLVCVICAGVINLVVFLNLLKISYIDNINRKKLITTSSLMLLNIPVVLFYIYFVFMLMGIMRISLVNNTNTTLKDISIIGCGSCHLDELKAGQSKIIWVDITGDCTIHIEYDLNGKQRKETVVGYTTPGMGAKIRYEITGEDKQSR